MAIRGASQRPFGIDEHGNHLLKRHGQGCGCMTMSGPGCFRREHFCLRRDDNQLPGGTWEAPMHVHIHVQYMYHGPVDLGHESSPRLHHKSWALCTKNSLTDRELPCRMSRVYDPDAGLRLDELMAAMVRYAHLGLPLIPTPFPPSSLPLSYF